MVGGGESDYSVCPRPLLQFLQFFQFMSDRLFQVTQDTSGYIRLPQFTSEGRDVELDNKKSVRKWQECKMAKIIYKVKIIFVFSKQQVLKIIYRI